MSSQNTSQNSLTNLLFQSDSRDPTPPPSLSPPFQFGPLPASPTCPPAMEIIMEVTETASSDTADTQKTGKGVSTASSSPVTEVARIEGCKRGQEEVMRRQTGLDLERADSCDCPAHVHDKELPLELVPEEGETSHFDF